MTQNKPNFFVVGAAKAGTSSLYNWLVQHPEISVPSKKEPSYFTNNYGYSDWHKYLNLFNIGPKTKAIGDTSATYLVTPESPDWIFRELGRVKIIIVLRNPAHRAYSLYAWMVMEGYEKIGDFERALVEEDVRFQNKDFYKHNPEYFWDYMYFRSGLYYEQVKRYLHIFGKENVKIYLFEDLVQNSRTVFKDLCSFLNVSTEFVPNFSHENKSKLPLSIELQYFMRVSFYKIIGKTPTRLRPLLKNSRDFIINFNKKIGHPSLIVPKVEYKLRGKYKEDIQKLGELINTDLTHWL